VAAARATLSSAILPIPVRSTRAPQINSWRPAFLPVPIALAVLPPASRIQATRAICTAPSPMANPSMPPTRRLRYFRTHRVHRALLVQQAAEQPQRAVVPQSRLRAQRPSLLPRPNLLLAQEATAQIIPQALAPSSSFSAIWTIGAVIWEVLLPWDPTSFNTVPSDAPKLLGAWIRPYSALHAT
jgi:hypothetical protein